MSIYHNRNAHTSCQKDMLIRYHSYPPFAATDNNPERKLLKIASNGELAKGFTLRKLCILERADVLGRISNNADDYRKGEFDCYQRNDDSRYFIDNSIIFDMMIYHHKDSKLNKL